MKKMLTRITFELWHYEKETKKDGKHSGLSGDCSGLFGDCTGLSGDCTCLSGHCTGLSGNCTGLFGNCSGLFGALDDCKITEKEREKGVPITLLIKGKDTDD